MCLLQCSPCSTVVIVVFSVAVVVTIDYESPVSCAISISRTTDILYLDRLGVFKLGSLAVTGNGTAAFVCGFFLPRRNLIKINELGVGETTKLKKLRQACLDVMRHRIDLISLIRHAYHVSQPSRF